MAEEEEDGNDNEAVPALGGGGRKGRAPRTGKDDGRHDNGT